jgi:hypothetical protein
MWKFVELLPLNSMFALLFRLIEKQLREKVRAYHTPGQEPDSAGHGLSADYWADVLTPPMFEKFRYGSNRQLKTAAAVSLEWSIPSPPDFHHFNMVCL